MSGGGAGCDGCGLARYCGEDCKEAGKEEHGEECRVLENLGKKKMMLSDQLRLVARIWFKIRKTNVVHVEQEGTFSQSWEDLMDHKEELMGDSEELMLAQYETLGSVLEKSDMPPMAKFVEICGKILTNAFSLRSDR